MTSPLVSVIIPAYNCAASLPTAVESVLVQTCPGVEVIVVDDGSTDDTPSVLTRLGQSVRWTRQENRGPGAARNRGLGLARGEYIMFLDADDWILPEKVERQVQRLTVCAPAGWVYCDVKYVDEGGGLLWLASDRFAYCKRGRLDGYLFPQLFQGNFIPVHAALLRRRCLEKTGPFDEDPRLIGVEDWDLLLRVAVRFHASYLPDVLAACVIRPGSLSADPSARDRRRFDLLDKAVGTFPKEIRALGWRGRRLVADTHNWFGYRLYWEGRWTEALERLRASLWAWPLQGRAWWYLSASRLRLARGQ